MAYDERAKKETTCPSVPFFFVFNVLRIRLTQISTKIARRSPPGNANKLGRDGWKLFSVQTRNVDAQISQARRSEK